jgi:hypothetical protein
MSKGINTGYLTPNEVLDRYPSLMTVHGMSEHTLGLFVKHRVLWGYHDTGKRLTLIEEASVINFINYMNQNLDRHHIPTDSPK